MPKDKPIKAPAKPAVTPTILGTGYAKQGAKKAKTRNTELERLLKEVNK